MHRLLYCAVLCCGVLRYGVLCCGVLCCSVLCCVVLCCSVHPLVRRIFFVFVRVISCNLCASSLKILMSLSYSCDFYRNLLPLPFFLLYPSPLFSIPTPFPQPSRYEDSEDGGPRGLQQKSLSEHTVLCASQARGSSSSSDER